MKEHVNFYENIKEANMRLKSTVVMYDGEPFYVWGIADHKGDGVFRMYVQPLGPLQGQPGMTPGTILNNIPTDHPQFGAQMDAWMDAHKEAGLIRKKMNSPHFNKFRPFPLGMCNQGPYCYYLERTPVRPKTEQGLTRSMLQETYVSCSGEGITKGPGATDVSMHSEGFRACILGDYPSATEVLKNLKDPKIENEAVAFNRQFALVRGPIGMLFLAYKGEVMGVLPNGDFSLLKLGRKFGHLKEVTEELGLFANMRT